MSDKKNYARVKPNYRLTNQQKGEIVQKLKEGISDKQIMTIYKISRRTLNRIKDSVDKINQLIRQERNLQKKRLNKYESSEERLYKWFRERKESGDSISYSQFKAEGLKLMDEFGGSKKLKARYLWLRACWTRFKSLLKFQNAPKNTENLAPRSDQVEQSAEKFIPKLMHRLEEEDIRRDNIYLMFKMKFTWRSLLPNTQKDTKEIDIQKLGNDGLTIIFCTNATGSRKLSPFYFYEYKTQKALKYLESNVAIPQTLKKDTLNQQIFADWYNNHFIKSVIKHQQETNVSGKVLLLVKNCKKFILPEDTMQNDDFERLFFPNMYRIFPLRQYINSIIRPKLKMVSKDFCTSYDMNIYIKSICKSWANCITPAYINSSWEKFLSDSRTEENTTSTALVKQTSKLVKNVTEEDTALMEVDSRKEAKRKNLSEILEKIQKKKMRLKS
ncbi:unnamed protein product [Lasius platythorax]|uniref:HTH CENPB-type domain-containing protein n=1 Tax=Lasius platythorax TaxID=488582 RepID=A0AAV2NNN8_9HYME